MGDEVVGGVGGAAKGLFAGGKIGRGVGIGASLGFGLGVSRRIDEVAICRRKDVEADRDVKDKRRVDGTDIACRDTGRSCEL